MENESIKFTFSSADPVVTVSLSFELPLGTLLDVSDHQADFPRDADIEDVEIRGIRARLQTVAVETLNQLADRLHQEILVFRTEIASMELAALRPTSSQV